MSATAKAKLEKERRAKKRRAKVLTFKTREGAVFHPEEALRIVKACARARFDESVDVQIQLGVDPRKANQTVRGVAALPHGTGKSEAIAVFARGEKAEEARRAGASIVGAEDLVEKVSKGEVSFTKAIATPDVMPLVGKVARVLGPRGLMPNPKLGTVTMNVKEAVAAAKKGQAEFRAEKRGIVMAAIGKVSFPASALKDNLRALLLSISDQRPEGLKGTFMKYAFLRSTMGPGIPVDMTFFDPTSPQFMEPPPPGSVPAGLSATPAAPAPAVAAAAPAAAAQAPLA